MGAILSRLPLHIDSIANIKLPVSTSSTTDSTLSDLNIDSSELPITQTDSLKAPKEIHINEIESIQLPEKLSMKILHGRIARTKSSSVGAKSEFNPIPGQHSNSNQSLHKTVLQKQFNQKQLSHFNKSTSQLDTKPSLLTKNISNPWLQKSMSCSSLCVPEIHTLSQTLEW